MNEETDVNVVFRGLGIFGKAVKGILVAVFLSLLFGYFVMLLWNWVMPNIFVGLREITYWQAAGMVLLVRLIFGTTGVERHEYHEWWHHGRHHMGSHRRREDLRYYDDWWNIEGKQALEAYIEQTKRGHN